MKITYSILGLSFITILLTWTQMPEVSTKDSNLSWAIETNAQGGSTVFGLELEKATVQQAQKVFQKQAAFVVSINHDKPTTLQAIFNKTSIAGFQTRIVLTLMATDNDINNILAQARKDKDLTDKPDYLPIPDELTATLSGYSFSKLSYLPSSHLDEDILKSRFGSPELVAQISEDNWHWFYPGKGLFIELSKNEKPIFQYVRPDRFNSLFQTEPIKYHTRANKLPDNSLDSQEKAGTHINGKN